MSELLLVVFGLAVAGVSLVCAAALVEVFRQLVEIRNKLEIDDKPMRLDFEEVDLRGVAELLPPGILRHRGVALVFLHGRCGTCRIVAESFKSSTPEMTWFVVPASDIEATASFVELAANGSVIADPEERLAEYLRIDVAPAVIAVQDGVAVSASGISSVRQLRQLLPTITDPTIPAPVNVGG